MGIKVERKCRYCENCIDNVNDDYCCMQTDLTMSKRTANKVNNCKAFRFTKYDAFTGKKIGEK